MLQVDTEMSNQADLEDTWIFVAPLRKTSGSAATFGSMIKLHGQNSDLQQVWFGALEVGQQQDWWSGDGPVMVNGGRNGVEPEPYGLWLGVEPQPCGLGLGFGSSEKRNGVWWCYEDGLISQEQE